MSVDNSCSGSSSNQDVVGNSAVERPKLLEGIGSTVVSLTCYVLRKSRHLPCLVGPVIGAVEDIVSPCIQPLVIKLGTEGMYLLALADEKLYAVGKITMEKVPFVSGFISNAKGVHSMFERATTVAFYAYEQVCERGMIGGAANTWVKYEVTVKSKSSDTLKFVKRLPLLGAFVPVIYTVGTPIASAISSWLVEHSEAQDKHLVFHEVHLLDDEGDLKGILEEKPLYVVDNGAEDSSRMDAHKNSSDIDSADRNLTPESPESSTHVEVVKKSDLHEEIGEAKPEDDGTADKGKSNVMIVAPVSSVDEDSDADDEVSVLFDAGWSVGKIGISGKSQISVESEARKKGWW